MRVHDSALKDGIDPEDAVYAARWPLWTDELDEDSPGRRTRRRRVVLAHCWQQLGRPYDTADPADGESGNAIITTTAGKFRLIERLMTRIARVTTINQLQAVEPRVVHATRQMLVVGSQ